MGQCQMCGAEVPEGVAQCPACGSALDVTTASFAPVESGSVELPVLEGAEGPVLVVYGGREAGERFYVDRPALTIGRDPNSDVFLNDVTVSRSHAVVRLEESTVSIEDSGSLNGTYVNGARVDRALLRDGDMVQVGTFQMVFLAGGES